MWAVQNTFVRPGLSAGVVRIQAASGPRVVPDHYCHRHTLMHKRRKHWATDSGNEMSFGATPKPRKGQDCQGASALKFHIISPPSSDTPSIPDSNSDVIVPEFVLPSCADHGLLKDVGDLELPPMEFVKLTSQATANEHAKATVVKQRRNILQRLAAFALDTIERTLVRELECRLPLPSTADPRIQLEGNFAPVPESPVEHELEVIGNLPPHLNGVYVRNGANPRFEPSAGHHFFDGDGMIHAVQFSNGIASYSCRYTRTYRFKEEETAGKSVFPKAIGELHGHGGVARILLYFARSLVGLVDYTQGLGVANAGLVYHNGCLLAMSEDDLPYAIQITDDGDLRTVGRFDFDGKLTESMIAHPKIDPETGELFSLSYNVIKPPFLKYFRVSPDGLKGEDVNITLPQATMIHDFAITKHFVVIPDQQVTFKLSEMISGGSPVVYDPTKKSRFGLLPKYDSDDHRMQWIEVPNCFCFHLWNAWEEGDEVVVLGSCMSPPDSVFNEHDHTPFTSILSEIRLNRSTGESTRREVAPNLNLEAGQLNRSRIGSRNRYLYMSVAEPFPKVSGVAKVDLESGEVQIFGYGDGCYGGEPVFVPRTSDENAAEDDGYVLTFMHNELTSQSQLLMLDASTPALDLIASVKIQSRVPYGLHGTFISAQDLARQQQYTYSV